MTPAAVGVVIATRNRAPSLARTLRQLNRLPERPPVVVVDNASTDGTPDLLAREFPQVQVVRLPANRGALARTVGVRALDTPYVAFSDDDSWWAPDALSRAARLFDAHPRLGLLSAHTSPASAPTQADLLDFVRRAAADTELIASLP
ncbi:glycosyltransferase family 2 protein, partial [Streptomyces nigra]